MLHPRKMLPSARTRTAGVFCGTESGSEFEKSRRKLRAQKNGRAQLPFYSLIPLAFVENYSRNRPLFASLLESQHVPHVVEARLAARDELRRPHRALAMVGARGRAMRELEALAGAGEIDRVVAHDVAAAGDGKADRSRLALAGLA